jgi:hypothetical protein
MSTYNLYDKNPCTGTDPLFSVEAVDWVEAIDHAGRLLEHQYNNVHPECVDDHDVWLLQPNGEVLRFRASVEYRASVYLTSRP